MKKTPTIIFGILAVFIIFSNPMKIAQAQESGFSCPLCTIPGEIDTGYFLSWQNAPPADMNQGEQTAISVKGRAVDGQHNLTWTIGGTGFSFAEYSDVQLVETTAGQITLYARGGAYLGQNVITDAAGLAQFDVSEGTYKVRADYLGYQFWSDDTLVTADTDISLTIAHQDVTITLEAGYQGTAESLSGVPVYLFTAAGVYMNQRDEGTLLTKLTYLSNMIGIKKWG